MGRTRRSKEEDLKKKKKNPEGSNPEERRRKHLALTNCFFSAKELEFLRLEFHMDFFFHVRLPLLTT